ncbi:MAG: hypothetical protein V4505_02330 [Pseudomonadota bacterium]
MNRKKITRNLGLVFAMLLGGCTTIQNGVQQNLRQAQDLANRCDELNQDTPQINIQALVERIQTRLRLECEESEAGCPFGVKRQVRELSAWIKGIPPTNLSTLKQDFDAFQTALHAFHEKVANLQTTAQGKIGQIGTSWEAAKLACRTMETQLECTPKLNAVLRQLDDVLGSTTDIAADMQEVQKAWKKVEDDIRASNYPFTAVGQQAFAEITNLLGAARQSIATIASIGASEFRRDFFDHLLPSYTAEKVLDFTERQLEVVDRLVDKVDDKAYFLGSAIVELNRGDIQQSFDTFYVTYVRKVFPSTESARAFARAACVKLSKPTATGRGVSIITPFIYSSMTHVEKESRWMERCNTENGNDPRAIPLCDGQLADARKQIIEKYEDHLPDNAFETRVEQQPIPIFFPTAKEAVPAPPPKSVVSTIPQATVFDTCLMSERALRKKAAVFQPNQTNQAVRDNTQQICGDVLLEKPQAQPHDLDALQAKLDAQIAKHDVPPAAAGLPPAVAPFAPAPQPLVAFCPKLAAALPSASCVETPEGAWIELAEAFSTGKSVEPRLVPPLRLLERLIVNLAPAGTGVTVRGAASFAPMACRQLGPTLQVAGQGACALASAKAVPTCSDNAGNSGAEDATSVNANNLLALRRAHWAASVMACSQPRKLADEALFSASLRDERPELGDQAFDRKILVQLRWRPAPSTAPASKTPGQVAQEDQAARSP